MYHIHKQLVIIVLLTIANIVAIDTKQKDCGALVVSPGAPRPILFIYDLSVVQMLAYAILLTQTLSLIGLVIEHERQLACV